MRLRSIVLFLLVLISCIPIVLAGTVNFISDTKQCTADLLYAAVPSANYGFISKWNISNLPADENDLVSVLWCSLNMTYGAVDDDVRIWRFMNQTWDESTINWSDIINGTYVNETNETIRVNKTV